MRGIFTKFLVTATAAVTLLGASVAYAQTPPPVTPAEAPPRVQFETEEPEGFEDLRAARDVSLNLFVDGQPLGQVDVQSSPGTVRFVNPADLIAKLPPLRDPAAVNAALKLPLTANAGLSCSPTPIAGCGRLDPDTLGVILSRDIGRLDLFLASGVRGEARQHLVAPPPGPPTLAGALGLQYSINQRGIDFTFQPRAMLGLGRGRLSLETTFSDRQSSLDRADYRWFGNRTSFSAGLISSSPFSFVYFDRLVGVSYGSSNETRIERGSNSDTPLILDTPLQGRVQIIRDGVLLGTQRVLPGRVTLDTSELPGGAYPISLKIIDATGERTEMRFFTRAPGLPAYGERQFFIEAGWNTAFRGSSDAFLPSLLSPTLRAGLSIRAAAQLGLSARAEVSEKRRLLEFGTTYFRNNWRINANFGATDDGEYAASLNASGNVKKFNWSLDARTIEASTQFNRDPERGLGRSYQQASAFVGYSRARFTLNSGILWRRDGPGQSSYTFLPTARWTLGQHGNQRWEAETTGSYTRDSWSLRAGLRMSLSRARSSINASAGVEGRHSNGATTFQPTGNVDWSTSRESDVGPLQLRAGISQQQDRTSGRMGANIRTTYADISADAQIEEQLSNSAVFGRVETSFGLAGGKFALGSGGFTGAGIIAQAPNADRDSVFSVRGLGANARPIRGSRSVFVSMPPFSQGEIGINAAGGSTNFDTRSEFATFYPGTVRKLVRVSARIITIYGQLFDRGGRPVTNALVESKGSITETDDQGRLQIEVAPDGELKVERDDGSVCVAKVPPLKGATMFASVGRLECSASSAR
jgi:Mat/Ecp fimbriae outer membrane usher protein